MARDVRWSWMLGLLLVGCGGGTGSGSTGTGNGGGSSGGGSAAGTPPKVEIGAPPGLSWVEGPTSFDDTFDAFDETRWRRSDGWASSEDFNAGWRADHVRFDGGAMTLQIDPESCPAGCSGRPYASGEFASTRFHGYGRYEVRMKPAKGPGLMTSFSLTTGPYEDTRWDEIDLSFLGSNPRRLQVNYISGSNAVRHDKTLELPFDASEDFHAYGIEWTRTAVHWYVDGKRIHSETGSGGPLPSTPGRILMNLWPGTGPSTEQWLGHFTYPSAPVTASFEELRYGPATSTQVLEGFESGDPKGDRIWALDAETGANIEFWPTIGHQGTALVMAYWTSAAQHASLVRAFPVPQDWRQVRWINFWFFGAATQDTFRMELRDNGASPSSAERFEYRFKDDTVGWKWMSVPLGSFTRRKDWQPAGAPNDGLTLSAVQGLAFEPLGGANHTVRLDDIELEQ